MDKNKKIAIVAGVAAVAVIIGAVAVTQGARLKTAASVAKSATMDAEQVTAKADENAQIAQEMQDQYQIPEITLTPEMEAAIADGSMTLEEAAAQFLSGGASQSETATTTESEAETPNPESAAQTSGTPSAPETVTETAEPSAPETVTETAEPSAPETPPPAPEVVEPTPTENAAPSPEPTPAPKAEETPAPEPEKPTETPAAKPSEPEPETASLSGETDSGRTEAQAASKADAGQTEASKADSGQTQAPEKSAEEKAKEERDAKVQNLFAQLYVLKNSFSNRVDAIINECIQEFLALEPSKQTKMTKVRIVYARMDDFEAMESDCNAQVESIAAQLDEIDPALGEKARQYYQNEKELKKSSLISQYGG